MKEQNYMLRFKTVGQIKELITDQSGIKAARIKTAKTKFDYNSNLDLCKIHSEFKTPEEFCKRLVNTELFVKLSPGEMDKLLFNDKNTKKIIKECEIGDFISFISYQEVYSLDSPDIMIKDRSFLNLTDVEICRVEKLKNESIDIPESPGFEQNKFNLSEIIWKNLPINNDIFSRLSNEAKTILFTIQFFLDVDESSVFFINQYTIFDTVKMDQVLFENAIKELEKIGAIKRLIKF